MPVTDEVEPEELARFDCWPERRRHQGHLRSGRNRRADASDRRCRPEREPRTSFWRSRPGSSLSSAPSASSSPIWSALALLAGLFTAAYIAVDTVVLGQKVIPSSLLYLLVGSWVLLAVTLLLGIVVGRRVDDAFRGYRLEYAKKPVVIATAAAGGILTYLQLTFLAIFSDPAALIPAEQSVVLLLLLWEWVRPSLLRLLQQLPWQRVYFADLPKLPADRSRSIPRRTWFFVSLVVIGSFLGTRNAVSFESFANAAELSALPLIAAVVVALFVYIKFREHGLGSGIDQINFRFWWVLWMAAGVSIGAFATGGVTWHELAALNVIQPAFLLVPASMLCVFVAFAAELKARAALRRDWLVSALLAASIPLTFGITVVLVVLADGNGERFLYGASAFERLPADPLVWAVRFVGVLLVGWGAIRLGRNSAGS